MIADEPEEADDAARSFAAVRIFPSVNPKIMADGLLATLGGLTFPIIRDQVEQIVTVSEAGIIAAMLFAWERAKLVIIPIAAVPIAVLWERRIDRAGLRVSVIVSGGNVSLDALPWRP